MPVPLQLLSVLLRPPPVHLQPPSGMRLKQGNHPLSNAANPHATEQINVRGRREGKGRARKCETEKEEEEGEETN